MEQTPPQPGKLFVGGLSFATTEEGLLNYFSKFGKVKEVIVMRNPSSKRSRGFGFVTYEGAAAASKCVDYAGQHRVDEQEVDVKHATPRAEPASSSPVNGNMKGKLKSAVMRKPRHKLPVKKGSGATGGMQRRGWEVEGATSSMGGMSISGSSSRSSARDGNAGQGDGSNSSDVIDPLAGTNKIFVGGLHYNTRKSGLIKYFEQFGEIRAAQVLFAKDTGKSRGFGFITFSEPAAVDRVLQQRMHEVDGKITEVKRATPKVDIGSHKIQRNRNGQVHRVGGHQDKINANSRLAGRTRRGSPNSRKYDGIPSTMNTINRGDLDHGFPASYAAMAAGGIVPSVPVPVTSTMIPPVTVPVSGGVVSSGIVAPGMSGLPGVTPVVMVPGGVGASVMNNQVNSSNITTNKNQVDEKKQQDTKSTVTAGGENLVQGSDAQSQVQGGMLMMENQIGHMMVPVTSTVIPTAVGPMFVQAPIGSASPYMSTNQIPAGSNIMGNADGLSFSQFGWGSNAVNTNASHFNMMPVGEMGGIMGHFNSGDGNLMGRNNINGQGSASINEDLRTEPGRNNVSKNDADES